MWFSRWFMRFLKALFAWYLYIQEEARRSIGWVGPTYGQPPRQSTLSSRASSSICPRSGQQVNHCLLALPGVSKTDIKRVMSHPQALAQTDGYTRKLGVVREAVDDTAGAAKLISEKGWR